jgi:isopenicillin N synthase-like dioxygenase
LNSWKGIGSALLENGSPDGAEFYNISQDSLLLPGSLPQPHPSPIHKAEDLLKSFALHARDVSALIFSHLNTHLDLPFGTLPQLHKINEPSMTTVRLIHAPPQPSCDRDRHIQARLLPGHTDNGSLTLLFNVIGGLQILPPDLSSSDDSNWRYVRPEPGCAIVNAGDALCQWSGGVLQSGIHRVVSPPGQQAICERYSFAYVVKPSNKASMKCLVGGEEEEDTDGQCTFEEWLLVKSKATLEGKSIVRIGGDSKGAN